MKRFMVGGIITLFFFFITLFTYFDMETSEVKLRNNN